MDPFEPPDVSGGKTHSGGTIEISSSASPTPSWQCATCDKSMRLVHKESHLASRSHAIRLQGNEQPRPRPKPPPLAKRVRKVLRVRAMYSAWVQQMRVKMPEINKIYNVSYPGPSRRTRNSSGPPWTCEICEQKMEHDYKWFHLDAYGSCPVGSLANRIYSVKIIGNPLKKS